MQTKCQLVSGHVPGQGMSMSPLRSQHPLLLLVEWHVSGSVMKCHFLRTFRPFLALLGVFLL